MNLLPTVVNPQPLPALALLHPLPLGAAEAPSLGRRGRLFGVHTVA